MGEWIKCTDKYPAHLQWVLAYAKFPSWEVIYWDNNVEKWRDEFLGKSYQKEMFSHWQPLPSPPEDI